MNPLINIAHFFPKTTPESPFKVQFTSFSIQNVNCAHFKKKCTKLNSY